MKLLKYLAASVMVLFSLITLMFIIAPVYLTRDLWRYIKTGKRKDWGYKGE